MTQSKTLLAAGFIRVDGLTARYPWGETYTIKHEAKEDWGSCFSNNSIDVVVTHDGQTWISAWEKPRWEMLQDMNLKRRSIFVPCSNQEQIRTRDLLIRASNPEWQPELLAA